MANPTAKSHVTPIGQVPDPEAIDLNGLDESITIDTMRRLLKVDTEEWLLEIAGIRKYYEQFGDHLPQVLGDELTNLEKRLRTYEPVPTNNVRMMEWVKQIRDRGTDSENEM